MSKCISSIDVRELFSADFLDYAVNTEKYGWTRYINLDNAATTPPLLAVEEGVKRYLAGYGSVHRGAGAKSKVSTDIYEHSREIIQDFVNAPPDSYTIFTGNTTGGMNTAAHFFSFLQGKVAVSVLEHSSSWLPWVKAEGERLLGSRQVTIDNMEAVNDEIQSLGNQQVIQYGIDGNYEFDLNEIESILKRNRIKVLVLTATSNLTGYRADIAAIARLAHKYGAYLLVDACQHLQHHKVDMQVSGIDFLTASGHKFYAPYGGGFLIGPQDFLDEFLPYQIGGGNLPYITAEGRFLRYKNQLAHDPGTPNAVGAVSMALALQTLDRLGLENIEAYEQRLAMRMRQALEADERVTLYTSKKHPSTVFPFTIEGRHPAEVAEELNTTYGIGIRAGGFCMYQAIRGMLNVTDESRIIDSVRRGSSELVPAVMRASIGLCNCQEDIDRFLAAIDEITRTPSG